jgi:hypothetical protein
MLAASAAAALLLLAPVAPAQEDAFDRALAEIDEALETNPRNVPEDSIKSCRAMRDTAVLLRKMGHHARAVRRIKSCRRLLGLDDFQSGRAPEPGVTWVA